MADAETRSYADTYSGLETEAFVALAVASICLTSFELMRRKRRKTKAYIAALAAGEGRELGSVESWEWGYLYQGRAWAKRPSPGLPRLPLSWVKQMIKFPEKDMLPLIGPDSTVYARFLRGTWYWTVLQTCTTLPILLPIHLTFASADYAKSSMQRASLSALIKTKKGQDLLVVHLILLLWLSTTWMANLFWIARGTFRYRREAVKLSVDEITAEEAESRANPVPGMDEETRRKIRGWRLRTVMVTNLPAPLRDEKLIQEYFDFYLARVKAEPPRAPGLVSGIVSFIYRFAQARAEQEVERDMKQIDEEAGQKHVAPQTELDPSVEGQTDLSEKKNAAPPVIEKVVVVRKMTELASLLGRRDDALRRLEEAHMKLAQKTLFGVQKWIVEKRKGCKSTHKYLKRMSQKEANVRAASAKNKERLGAGNTDGEQQQEQTEPPRPVMGETEEENEKMMEFLTVALTPYLEEFGLIPPGPPKTHPSGKASTSPWIYRKLRGVGGSHSRESTDENDHPETMAASSTYPPSSAAPHLEESTTTKIDRPSIWEVLHALPRHYLDGFQPLIRLNSLFRGATVPAIDYYATKLGLLTALIHESRSRPTSDYIPASTAFVTFVDPEDAMKVIKLLPSHPKNPVACLVTPAPEYGDIDWSRLMTKTFTGEFLKDWVVDLGVWGFTVFWIIPVSLMVSLVSVNTLSTIWPGLSNYLSKHPFKKEIISSLLPTLLVTLLSILVPLILLLIAKKAHNIILLSKLHDLILTRYHKFLVCNVLVFFCVGVSALESFLQSFKQSATHLGDIAQKFPDAAQFYVGWMIFQTAMHGGLELGLLGLPLIVYPATVLRAKTPRRRQAGTRPRTFNFYYWLPNHLIVLFIAFTFSILNPLVIPFACTYFSVALVVFKHQFIQVYGKAYEMNARVLIIRMIRYSLDGIVLAQLIYFALTVLEKKVVLAVFAGLFMVSTVAVKLYMTSLCRANFAIDDINEAQAVCGAGEASSAPPDHSVEPKTQEPPAPAEVIEVEDQQLLDHAADPPPREEHPSFGHRIHNFFHQHPGQHHRHRTEEHHSSIRFWTWRLPSGAVQFAYSTIPTRPNYHALNPFGPLQPPPLAHQSPNPSAEGGTSSPTAVSHDPHSPPTMSPTTTNPFGDGRDKTRHSSLVDLHAVRRHDLVQPHEKRQPYDDHPRYDLMYENPNYTRPIDNVLWLPVNPCAILDLNETLDVFKAITSEPGAGSLGQWINETSSMMPEPPGTRRSVEITEVNEVEAEAEEGVTELPLFGTERIELPPAIECRVEEDGSDVEQAETADNGFFGLPRTPQRRGTMSSMASAQFSPTGGRSFSAGTVTSSVKRRRSSTLRPVSSYASNYLQPPGAPASPVGLGLPSSYSPASPRTPNRMMSLNSTRNGRGRSGSIVASQNGFNPFDAGNHVDLGSQTPFADPNFNILLRSSSRMMDQSPEEISPELGATPTGHISIAAEHPQNPSRQLSVTRMGRARSNSRFSVSTREAVVGEVLAEEQIATAERVQKESQESEANSATRSWMTSWLYNTLHHDSPDHE